MREALLACTTREQLDEVLAQYGATEASATAQAIGGEDHEIHTIHAGELTITLHQWPADHDGYGIATHSSPIKVLEVA